jgi:hypothetical protein
MNVIVDRAAPADDEAIRGLLRRQPMPGRISLSFEREPNFALGCAVTGDHHDIVVARAGEGREVVGVAVRSTRRVFINGVEQRVGYLGQLRVDDRFRGRWLVSRGFSLLADIDRADPVPVYLASIVDGNDEATGVLVRRRRSSFPAFHEVTSYRTLALALRRSRRTAPGEEEIVAASPEQIPALIGFLRTHGRRRQLFPAWTEDAVRNFAPLGLSIDNIRVARRDGRVVGVIGLWDQSAYKQAVVRGYSGWLKPAGWLGGLIVPRIGAHVRSAYAAMICIANDDLAVFSCLLRHVCDLAAAARFEYLVLGLDVRDPLLAIARSYRHFSYPSRLYLASWCNRGPFHEQLDQRPAYVDVATL